MAKFSYQIKVRDQVVYQQGGFNTRKLAVHAANIQRDQMRGGDIFTYVRSAGPRPVYLVAIGREDQ